MPELPEVETTVLDLNKSQPPILGAGFIDVWTDCPNIIKSPKSFEQFKKEIIGKKIQKIWRRGKNIIFNLSNNKVLLIHQKLTGHLLLGKWRLKSGNWEPLNNGFLKDPINRYIHLMFWLSGDLMLALSDLRKFAGVKLLDKKSAEQELSSLGPELLDKNFTFGKFKKILAKQKRGKIKQVLMDQTVVAGIGNIYSDEILWAAKIHPAKEIKKLGNAELKGIFTATKEILLMAIKAGGESISDYRRPSGKKGDFDPLRKVYRREGEKCFRCGTIIKRVKIAGRSAHFCPKCQRL